MVFSVGVCLVGLWWTVDTLPQTKGEKPDPAGVLALLPSLVGVVLGGWGAWAGIQALHNQRTASVIADELAGLVARVEGVQYRQLLGSGPAAPDGRIDLAFTVTATGMSSSRADGTLEGIAEYYRSLRPGRMVITGTPSEGRDGRMGGDAGTGKTVLALSLILGLAKERSPQEPVPVRLTAASWPGSGIRDWLRTHLTDVYRLPRREAARLVDANLVLPVIDGLDEMDPGTAPGYTSRAAAFLRRIERFEHGGEHCPVVVTCRHAHYQALVEAGTEPRTVAHVAVARVDASRAHRYLSQRVAGTERGRDRWQPVLSALDAMTAGPVGTVQPAHTLLAEVLDTPWRLTLVATVFEERTVDGRYLRDPGDLLVLAPGGHLYEYLLDHYIGAAVATRHRESDGIPRPSGTHTADTVWRNLAFLARYLNDNSGPQDGPPRYVAGRALSSTDLVLHELWPLGGKHRTRWTERVLAVTAPLLLVSLAGLLVAGDSFELVAPWAFLLCFAVLYRSAWPKPWRIDFGRLRTPAGRRALALGSTVGFSIGFLVFFGLFYSIFGFFYATNEASDPWLLQDSLVVGLAFGLATGLAAGLARGLMSKQEQAGVLPHHLIRMDLTAAIVFGPVTAVAATFLSGLVSLLAFNTLYGVSFGDLPFLTVSFFGLMIGAFIFGLPVAGGSAALRYFALLLHIRRKLPWRLGRFLDVCYELGILRVSGTAWQFRHRELQDHLATRPVPPPRS
ncbi:NACHT domain-containing protein [Streptomyces sp. NPDC023327]|uniref:NACHT domain-containing protein n=1 Tax=Streptomyces sp. NPDC023327 TaxID=3157088 RepID=UPI00340BB7F2